MIIERDLPRAAPSAALIGQKASANAPAFAGRISAEAPRSPGLFLVSDPDGEPKVKLDVYDGGGHMLGQTAEPNRTVQGLCRERGAIVDALMLSLPCHGPGNFI